MRSERDDRLMTLGAAAGNAVHGGSARLQRAEARLVRCPCCAGDGAFFGEPCEQCSTAGWLAPSEVERVVAAMRRLGLRSEVACAA